MNSTANEFPKLVWEGSFSRLVRVFDEENGRTRLVVETKRASNAMGFPNWETLYQVDFYPGYEIAEALEKALEQIRTMLRTP